MKSLIVTVALAAALLLPLPAGAVVHPAPLAINVKFTSFTSPVARNTYARVTIHTSAHASCKIRVVYSTGKSHASGLGARTANGSGTAHWKWLVDGGTAVGKWPVTVTCQSGEAKARKTRMQTVTA
jgi:hypothetical protein